MSYAALLNRIPALYGARLLPTQRTVSICLVLPALATSGRKREPLAAGFRRVESILPVKAKWQLAHTTGNGEKAENWDPFPYQPLY